MIITIQQHTIFWATWCHPCIENIPELNKLISVYSSNKDVTFLNVCIESPKAKWLVNLQKYQLRGVNLFAEGNWTKKLRSHFNINGIPHYVLISQGNVLYENNADKAPLVKNKIDKLLGTEAPQQSME